MPKSTVRALILATLLTTGLVGTVHVATGTAASSPRTAAAAPSEREMGCAVCWGPA
jgi:hypothetical protein